MIYRNLLLLLLRVAAGLALAMTVALHSGCLVVAAGAAGAGTVAYVRGELEQSIDKNFDATVHAANRAVEQLQFAKVSEKKDALVAVIIARTAADKKIEIKVSSVGDKLSKVQIRVGLLGDEALSIRILEKIKANL